MLDERQSLEAEELLKWLDGYGLHDSSDPRCVSAYVKRTCPETRCPVCWARRILIPDREIG